MRISMFKQSGPKGFNFKPRYYDADKEELNARVDLLKRDLEADDELKDMYQGGEVLRQKLRANRGHYNKSKAAQKKSNIRIIMIAGILAVITYVLLTY